MWQYETFIHFGYITVDIIGCVDGKYEHNSTKATCRDFAKISLSVGATLVVSPTTTLVLSPLLSLSLSLVTRRRRRRQTGYSTVPSLDEDSSGADNGGRRDENEGGGGGGGGRRCFRGTCRGVHNVEVGRRVAKQTYHNPTRRDARRDIILRARAYTCARGWKREGYGTCYVQATGINMYGT